MASAIAVDNRPISAESPLTPSVGFLNVLVNNTRNYPEIGATFSGIAESDTRRDTETRLDAPNRRC